MYKTKLQELCQRRSWNLPVYSPNREGPGHNPLHTAIVTVNGSDFHSPSPCRTAKEAENNAAKVAFEHFWVLAPSQPYSPSLHPPPSNPPSFLNPSIQQPFFVPSNFPQPSFPQPYIPQPSVPAPSDPPAPVSEVDNIFLGRNVLQPKLQEAPETSHINNPVAAVEDNMKAGDQRNDLDIQRLYKSQLQNYAQKRNLGHPVYAFEQEGPPHNSRFKCKVTINGETYESSEFFCTLKDAEHAAAKVALMSLPSDITREDDNGLYKNLLQELVQKKGLHLPIYNTQRSGEAHRPIFTSSVELEGEVFTGQEAKTKKQAEMSAAKIAYTKLQERIGKSDQRSLVSVSTHQGQAPKLSSPSLESNVTTSQQHNANLKSISPGFVTQNLSKKTEEPATGKRSLSSIADGLIEDASLSNDIASPSFSNCTNVALDSIAMPSAAETIPSHKRRVTVFSRKTNVSIPEGGALLPISDDQWAAYLYSK